MEIREILARVDHTVLAQDAKWENIAKACLEAVEYGTASVCIPPSFVKRARVQVGLSKKICTVVGFPNGYSTTLSKCFEVEDALSNGADEFDMVIDIGLLKDRNYAALLNQITEVKKVCGGHILKVIVETCLLTETEKIAVSGIVSDSGAEYIKTSTGFSKAGATFDDVKLFAAHKSPELKIKAAGGIRTLEDAAEFIRLGASRLGTSSLVRLAGKLSEEEKHADL